MKYHEWKIPPEPALIPPQLTECGYEPLLAALLARRGLDAPEKARAFLDGGPELLCDPMLLPDMEKGAARLRAAVENRERVVVYGDYDVDGITAACLLTDWLRARGVPCRPYIPDRVDEGYGLNAAAVRTVAAEGAALIVTVDCGITAAEEAALAASLGVDLLITDHHECGAGSLPAACAVVDPKRPDSAYPEPGLAGVGVAFKLLCAVSGETEALLDAYADLVATGTVADVMPLTGENRYIVRRGLQKLARAPRPGLRALLRASGAADKPVTSTTVGFTLAPRINAAGRMSRAAAAVDLLLAKDDAAAEPPAAELCSLNRDRQAREKQIWEEARARLGDSPPEEPIVLADEGWHQGVVGIVASRLAEEYGLPAVMICLDGGEGKGSCRSSGGFNLFDALTACADSLERFGGHALAAGLSIRSDRVDDFRAALADYYQAHPGAGAPTLSCDLRVDDAALLDGRNVASLARLEPFGTGNPKPVLVLTDAFVKRVIPIGGGRHLKLVLQKDGQDFDCVFFGHTAGELCVAEGGRADAAFFPQINEYRAVCGVQLLITDLRPAQPEPPCRRVPAEEGAAALGRHILEGAEPLPEEAADFCPERADFKRVWRWLEASDGAAAGLPGPDWGPKGLHPVRCALALRVFAELGLVELAFDGLHAAVRIAEPVRRTSLENSALLARLRRARDARRAHKIG